MERAAISIGSFAELVQLFGGGEGSFSLFLLLSFPLPYLTAFIGSKWGLKKLVWRGKKQGKKK